MPYYGQGDYYATGGFFDFIKKVGKTALGFVPGGQVVGAGLSILGGGGGPPPLIRKPGFVGGMERLVPGGASGMIVDPMTGEVKKRRRRMNYANGRALSRANRRVDGFVRLAKRSLKHTNYKIVSKSSGRSRPRVSVSEHGPGSVSVRG